MSQNKGMTDEITKKYQLHNKDTGSADVQIALLSARIEELQEHLKLHSKDQHNRLSLLKCVGQRRKLLEYLKQTDTERYKRLLEKLNLRK